MIIHFIGFNLRNPDLFKDLLYPVLDFGCYSQAFLSGIMDLIYLIVQ